MTQFPFIPEELKPEISTRIGKIRKFMARENADALLVASNANIFYTTGRFFRGYVYIPAQGEPLYFVIRPTVFDPSSTLITLRKPEMIADALSERGHQIPESVALEFDSLSYSDILRLKGCFPDARFLNASPMLRDARMVKTEYEINEMRKDGMHQVAVYRRIAHLYKEDMTDLEFQIEIERTLRLEGCLGMLRVAGNLMECNLGSVINGKNADTPSPYDFSMGGAGTSPAHPVGADGSIMHSGTTVMVDMNGSFNGYQTDMTRVWSIGHISELAKKAHACSIRILHELEALARPGLEVCELYKRAEAIAREEELEDYFMGHTQKAGFIGHGVGIELNEQPAITPRSRVKLEAGMTLAIEPKFVIPEVGAVGPENTYVVRSQGLENLTSYTEEIQELV
ncbi:MAG: Xaa-Pro peptidase family protein [Muribaculum sp.]|nr:Xaa-Pro peptidase family protein [Muribaculum sp.]